MAHRSQILLTMPHPVYIVSDLHLGSEFCHATEFMRFLSELPDNAELILNGDTVTRWHRNLTEEHLNVLNRLHDESFNRKVVWIKGNHDHAYEVEKPGNIEFTSSHSLNDETVIRHGHEFDIIQTILKPIVVSVYLFYRLLFKLGISTVPSSGFAKQMAWLYIPYKNLFVENTIFYAGRSGIRTIICGHIHFTEERQRDGVQYFNAGTWVETPLSYILIENDTIQLKEFNN